MPLPRPKLRARRGEETRFLLFPLFFLIRQTLEFSERVCVPFALLHCVEATKLATIINGANAEGEEKGVLKGVLFLSLAASAYFSLPAIGLQRSRSI